MIIRFLDHIVLTCPWCRWPFHVPRAQVGSRVECRACESRGLVGE
jgi:hypothetical protein